MPAAFLRAVRTIKRTGQGRVRRKTLSKGRYINIAFLHGKSYAGEVHKKKKG